MIFPYNLCLGNVSKYFSASNLKKTGFNGYIYDFSVDYNSIDVNHIKDIQKYFITKMAQHENVKIYKANICPNKKKMFLDMITHIK